MPQPTPHRPRGPRRYVPARGGERAHWAYGSGQWASAPPRPAPPKRPAPRPVVDPFAPKSDAQLRAEAQGMVQAGLGSLLDEITARFNRAGEAGQSRITGATQTLGNLLAGVGPASQDIYDRARSTEQAAAGQLASSLGQFGQGLSAEQAHALALQNAPEALQSSVPAAALQNAQGAANAGLASQTAESQMLNTQGAAAGVYGAKLPGIAALTGMQHSRDLEAKLAADLADELGSARSNAQQSLTSILQHLKDNELTKAEYKQSGLFNQAKLDQQAKDKAAQLRYKQQKDRYDRQLKLQQLGISAARVREYARHNGITEAQAEAKLIAQNQRASAARRDANRRQTQWKVDAKGNFVYRINPRTGKKERVPLPPRGKGKSKGKSGDGYD